MINWFKYLEKMSVTCTCRHMTVWNIKKGKYHLRSLDTWSDTYKSTIVNKSV